VGKKRTGGKKGKPEEKKNTPEESSWRAVQGRKKKVKPIHEKRGGQKGGGKARENWRPETHRIKKIKMIMGGGEKGSLYKLAEKKKE